MSVLLIALAAPVLDYARPGYVAMASNVNGGRTAQVRGTCDAQGERNQRSSSVALHIAREKKCRSPCHATVTEGAHEVCGVVHWGCRICLNHRAYMVLFNDRGISMVLSAFEIWLRALVLVFEVPNNGISGILWWVTRSPADTYSPTVLEMDGLKIGATSRL